jgi:cob(I)alamin adenosyltransferase
MSNESKFLTIINTGEGKGKTTAAMGIVLRTIAHGWKAAVVQFMKGPDDFRYGEAKFADMVTGLDIFTMGRGFTWNSDDLEKDKLAALDAWVKAREVIESNEYRLVLLDEIVYAIHYGFLDEKEIVAYLSQREKHCHVILTGRNASDSLIEVADLVTEMKNIKHPFKDRGLKAQKGIDW